MYPLFITGVLLSRALPVWNFEPCLSLAGEREDCSVATALLVLHLLGNGIIPTKIYILLLFSILLKSLYYRALRLWYRVDFQDPVLEDFTAMQQKEERL